MLERDFQDYLFDNPAVLFPGQAVRRKQREVYVEGRRIDLLFEVDGAQHIVELKRDTIKREHIGQIFEYYGLLRQANTTLKYKMILVAPVIPPYRRIVLEEFGIRCVEVHYPAASPEIQVKRQLSKNRNLEIRDLSSPAPAQIGFRDFVPPINSVTLQLSHRLLIDSLPTVQRIFSEYEVMPVRVANSNHPDILCIPGTKGSQDRLLKVGTWWAYSFGHSKTMPKNDVPNLSVNALPWGLDIAVNAELRTSQEVMRAKVLRSPEQFNKLVREHGSLHLQAWLKLEHQPRIYHWVPLLQRDPGAWNSSSLSLFHQNAEKDFKVLREHWITWIKTRRPELTTKQVNHMETTNRNLNLALRLVQTLSEDDPLWKFPYQRQVRELELQYKRLKPLIDFFL